MAKANRLIHESSPYLLQHAHNPVDWQAWGKEALAQAQKEDKPILLSIGYSACHWCHVMEHESFEDETVAEIMNNHFVCIKLDREERPDIDQIYMDAIQHMGLNGGWPLNVFLMPNQKPFYGGTYFPKPKWIELLESVAVAYQKNKDKLGESAEQFAAALNQSEAEKLDFGQLKEQDFTEQDLAVTFEMLKKFFDQDQGGTLGAPKFPMPVIWEFLTTYHQLTDDKEALAHLALTLNEMANGGIYDQIGGGFARYAVDAEWFAPHFEKMLYDNGQLISIYANGFLATKNNRYAEVVAETIDFCERELKAEKGGYHAALDADSEGVEGKYYTWTYQEWQDVLGTESDLLAQYYGIEPSGNWENGVNIPYLKSSLDDFARLKNISPDAFKKQLSNAKALLLQKRAERVRPGLDNKILSGWNGLLLKGLCDAHKALPANGYDRLAFDLADFLISQFIHNGKLFRTYTDHNKLPGYLEDYAAVIQGLLSAFELSSHKQYLDTAQQLSQYCIDHFFDEQEQLFHYTDANGEALIARKKEIFDNVIPSSNAIMAENLHWLSIYSGDDRFHTISNEMLKQVKHIIRKEPRYMAKWAHVLSLKLRATKEIIIMGENAKAEQQTFWQHHFPNVCVLASQQPDDNLTIFKGRTAINNQTTFYVCENRACKLPVHSLNEALKQL